MRAFILLLIPATFAAADESAFERNVRPLLRTSCVGCHDGSDERMNLAELPFELDSPDNFRKWEHVWKRISSGEMPPATEARPAPAQKDGAESALKKALNSASLAKQQRDGRVILRRLNRTEYSFTLQDLLGIPDDLSPMIPEENSTGFDTVAATQGFSPLHVESFLNAADAALVAVLQLGKKPDNDKQHFPFKEQEGVRRNLDKSNNGGRPIIGELDDAIVMFSDASYIYKVHGLSISQPGRYRIRARAWGHQTEKPVVLSLNAGNYKKGRQRILDFFDLRPDTPQTVEVVATLERNEYLFPAPLDLESQEDGKSIWNIGPDNYTGSGVALSWVEVEGPLVESWPPQYTRDFLSGVEIREYDHIRWINDQHIQYEIVANDPQRSLSEVVTRLATKAFRRPVSADEIAEFVSLGHAALQDGRSFQDAVRIACRDVLNSPGFLFFASKPGPLDAHALASRLSYFLWKSLPDDQLLALAKSGRLTAPDVLRQQVDRMLSDPKSERFVADFADQWLQLRDINNTSPDRKLYPEFDDMLKLSMLEETHRFLTHLIADDLSTDNLIDSNFTMLNRRLAEHYGIDGVSGQEFRKVELPQKSPRGGVMTHAGVLKVTANGTVTSPVTRGSWVLTKLLGQPPSPPPPGIGSIEPDTRGTTTIRETLAKHRNDAACASCHNQIDPPGFALECFDVIGGFRDSYRSVGEGKRTTKKLRGRSIWEYKIGLPVDSSGQTADGKRFADIIEFKQLLMNERDQVARNVIQQLAVYSTGAEIQFADRSEIETILERCQKSNFGMRTIIHEVVQSRLFRNK